MCIFHKGNYVYGWLRIKKITTQITNNKLERFRLRNVSNAQTVM